MSRTSWLARLPLFKQLYAVHDGFWQMHLRQALLVQAERERLLAQPRYAERLNRHESRTFSQNGEDGLIAEALHRIGEGDRTFLEIGVGNGLENNTAALLARGWSGTWIEGDPRCCAAIRSQFAAVISAGRLRLIEARVHATTIDALLRQHQVPDRVDVLSLDIDRDTWHVWAALTPRRSARLTVIEYNPRFVPPTLWVVPAVPAPGRAWNGGSAYGASLSAIAVHGSDAGLALIACDVTGSNALLVEATDAQHFPWPHTAEHLFEPCRMGLWPRIDHPPCWDDRQPWQPPPGRL